MIIGLAEMNPSLSAMTRMSICYYNFNSVDVVLLGFVRLFACLFVCWVVNDNRQ